MVLITESGLISWLKWSARIRGGWYHLFSLRATTLLTVSVTTPLDAPTTALHFSQDINPLSVIKTMGGKKNICSKCRSHIAKLISFILFKGYNSAHCIGYDTTWCPHHLTIGMMQTFGVLLYSIYNISRLHHFLSPLKCGCLRETIAHVSTLVGDLRNHSEWSSWHRTKSMMQTGNTFKRW
jgi:hypothetical protein